MKIYITLLLLFFNWALYAQTVKPVYVLEYTRNTKAISEIEKETQKANFGTIIGDKPNGADQLRAMFSEVGRTTIYYRLDTVLIVSTHDGIQSKQIGYQYGGIMQGIDLRTGQRMVFTPASLKKSVDRALGEGSFVANGLQNTSGSARKIRNKEMMGGLICEKWQESLPQFETTAQYWILPGKAALFPFPAGSSFLYRQELIVKSEIHSIPLFEKIETQELTKIDSLTEFSIQEKVNDLLNQYVVGFYQNIEQNKHMVTTPLSINDDIGNWSFLEIESSRITSLKGLPGQWDYLLVDIWASWCGPCLKSFPELNKLKQSYSGSLQVLSLNYADTDLEKVKEVLKKYMPDWPQGFASHQVHDLLNPMRMYPSMVLIDRNGKVVMIGKPDLSLNEIRTFLDEHIAPRK